MFAGAVGNARRLRAGEAAGAWAGTIDRVAGGDRGDGPSQLADSDGERGVEDVDHRRPAPLRRPAVHRRRRRRGLPRGGRRRRHVRRRRQRHADRDPTGRRRRRLRHGDQRAATCRRGSTPTWGPATTSSPSSNNSQIVTALGGAGNDNLFSGAAVDRLEGGPGNDGLGGGSASDELLGGAGLRQRAPTAATPATSCSTSTAGATTATRRWERPTCCRASSRSRAAAATT